jgi:hypothetical protein
LWFGWVLFVICWPMGLPIALRFRTWAERFHIRNLCLFLWTGQTICGKLINNRPLLTSVPLRHHQIEEGLPVFLYLFWLKVAITSSASLLSISNMASSPLWCLICVNLLMFSTEQCFSIAYSINKLWSYACEADFL